MRAKQGEASAVLLPPKQIVCKATQSLHLLSRKSSTSLVTSWAVPRSAAVQVLCKASSSRLTPPGVASTTQTLVKRSEGCCKPAMELQVEWMEALAATAPTEYLRRSPDGTSKLGQLYGLAADAGLVPPTAADDIARLHSLFEMALDHGLGGIVLDYIELVRPARRLHPEPGRASLTSPWRPSDFPLAGLLRQLPDLQRSAGSFPARLEVCAALAAQAAGSREGPPCVLACPRPQCHRLCRCGCLCCCRWCCCCCCSATEASAAAAGSAAAAAAAEASAARCLRHCAWLEGRLLTLHSSNQPCSRRVCVHSTSRCSACCRPTTCHPPLSTVDRPMLLRRSTPRSIPQHLSTPSLYSLSPTFPPAVLAKELGRLQMLRLVAAALQRPPAAAAAAAAEPAAAAGELAEAARLVQCAKVLAWLSQQGMAFDRATGRYFSEQEWRSVAAKRREGAAAAAAADSGLFLSDLAAELAQHGIDTRAYPPPSVDRLLTSLFLSQPSGGAGGSSRVTAGGRAGMAPAPPSSSASLADSDSSDSEAVLHVKLALLAYYLADGGFMTAAAITSGLL